MKLIKSALFIIVIILILNALGMLNSKTSERVDSAVEKAKVNLNDFNYKGNSIMDMSLKELSTNISTDIRYLKEEVITDDGIVLSGLGIRTTINPSEERVLYAEVDASEAKAVDAIEKLLLNITKKEIKVPEELITKGNFTVTIDKVDGEYNIEFNK